MAKVNYTKLRKEDKLVLRDKNNQEVKNVIFPNGIQVGIEGNEHFNDSTLILPSSGVPSNTSSRLYNENGVLKFGGVAITTGSQSGGWTDDGSAVRLTTSTDDVGIGVASPQNKLHIEDSEQPAYLFLSRNDATILDGDYLGGVIFGGTEDGSSWGPSAYITAQATEDWTETSDEGTRLTFWTTPDTTAAVSAAMIINSNGNVSIGSSVSSYKLDVTNGDARIFGDDGYNGTGDKAKLYLGDGNAGAYAEWGEGLVFSVYKSSGDGGLVDGSGDSMDAVWIEEVTGHVGIGISDPSSPLHVSHSHAGFLADFTNDGNNSNRYGIKVQCGADDSLGTNYALWIYDGDGDSQGGIKFTGGTVTYDPFTGAHHTKLQDDDANYDFGIILRIQSVERSQPKAVDYVCTQTTAAKDPAVLGVYNSNLKNAPDDHFHSKHDVWALGDGYILVCSEGGDISTGDYICSSNTPGHGMKQDDDLMHNYTVAKASESVSWSEESSMMKLIACTYHCG